jgi:hypothetical protein
LDGTFATAKAEADSLAELLSVAKFPMDKIDKDIKGHSVFNFQINLIVMGCKVLGSPPSIKVWIHENSI